MDHSPPPPPLSTSADVDPAPPPAPSATEPPATPPALPVPSWSPTRRRLLHGCARALYWQYWGSRGGWRTDADPLARAAWICRHFTSVPRLVGDVCHQAARALVLAIREGRPRPSYDALLQGARLGMRQVWIASQPEQVHRFLRWPAEHPVLHEVVVGGGVRPETREAAGQLLRSCLRHLVAAPLLDDIAEAHPAEVLVGGAGPERFLVAPEHTVYAVVDLAYRHQDPGRLPPDVRAHVSGPCWCVGEIKSGAPQPGHEWLQIATYVLWLLSLGMAPTDDVFLGRVTYLRGGTERWFVVTPDDLSRARALILTDVAAERDLVTAAYGAEGLSHDEREAVFARTTDVRRCSGCDFATVCYPAAQGPAGPGVPPEITREGGRP